MNNVAKVSIQEEHGGFAITVNGERFHFDQEDSVEGLVAVFDKINDMIPNLEHIESTYEEVY